MLPVRKRMRLPGWNYSEEGAYFLTVCTRNRRPILSQVVGRGILDAPEIRLTQYGACVEDTMLYLASHNSDVVIHNWVIMPNHLHILLSVVPGTCGASGMPRPTEVTNGASGMPRPTDAVIPKFISSLKRFTNRRANTRLWQDGYYDHIIRDDKDFIRRWQYIDNNPAAWLDDEYFPA